MRRLLCADATGVVCTGGTRGDLPLIFHGFPPEDFIMLEVRSVFTTLSSIDVVKLLVSKRELYCVSHRLMQIV